MCAFAPGLYVEKMHGTHNDFVVVDERVLRLGDYTAMARRLCAFLAADGLLAIDQPPRGSEAFASMRIYNADGSEAEMCGNGMRCVAQYLGERGAPERFLVATAAGPIGIEILERGAQYCVRVDVGKPQLLDEGREATIDAAGQTWAYRSVSLGNPHIVIVVDNVAAVDVERAGAALATHPRFPSGTNVHFLESIDRHQIRVRHYERGVGITQSCGTGAVAAAVAAIVAGLVESPVTVQVPGGKLTVEWQPGGSATLAGPSEKVSGRMLQYGFDRAESLNHH
jgi:diaminopimelate epimerase